MFDLTKIKKKNICFIGLMGSGKSIIGKELSKYLDLRFFDSDKAIEDETKKSINSIFQEEGELYFRNLEERICLELLSYENCIISLGGGSIINSKIRESIKKNSYSIYLNVNIKNLLIRVKKSNKRPLLYQYKNNEEILTNLFKDRQKFYEKADFIVNNNNDKYKVINEIKNKLRSYAK